ncbi:hypothetical protein ACQ4M4_02250 [Leptolyngbya sp. AN02str]|uniref:hypothetical protein n=1 Tax=Leptolyngbya sp. AN02str TaxID=3423363 RepID=UPI003D30F093
MAIFRQYIAPFLVLLIFGLALFVVSARIFLPEDMAAPAPTEPAASVSMQQPNPPHGAIATPIVWSIHDLWA